MMRAQRVDVMCCQDVRLMDEELDWYTGQVQLAFGVQSKCFLDAAAVGSPKSRVGGQLILITQLWGAKCSTHLKDPTQQGVLSAIHIDLEDNSKLLIISVYWPVKAAERDTRPGRLWNRVLQHLRSVNKSEMSPLAYIQSELESITTTHMKEAGSSAVMCGDFNASWFNSRSSHVLKDWAEECLWSNALVTLTGQQDTLRTYWHNPVKPTSWVDHFLWHTGSSLQCSGGESCMARSGRM